MTIFDTYLVMMLLILNTKLFILIGLGIELSDDDFEEDKLYN
jgi:hypothetical protein